MTPKIIDTKPGPPPVLTKRGADILVRVEKLLDEAGKAAGKTSSNDPKQPGKPADKSAPFTCPIGSTVHEFAGVVHRDFQEGLKSARIWGTGVFDGQTVKRDHVLHDKDVVELHT